MEKMKSIKILTFIWLFQMAFFANAQYQTSSHTKGTGHYLNPIFAGDYPDPSIILDGDTYYMVHSSFEYYPGLLIWQSNDLINWVPVTNALHKYLGSVWAPDLVKHNNKYYIYFPANDKIYVVWANSINGPWSEPVNLKINSIDPGHVADENGKRYLYSANGTCVALADDGLSAKGEPKHVYAGWPIPREWSIECFCMESPKITKRGDYYYLTVAEGGTAGPATGHMIISARSKSPLGPWENSPYNPIERTIDNSERWWSKGHGTLFEDRNGDWWMLFHAYENGFYNMGRQTLLQPVEWTADGWFKMQEGIMTDKPIPMPKGEPSTTAFSLNDNFSGTSLKPHWKFFGEYDASRYNVGNNALVVKAKGNTVGNCSPLLCVSSDHSYIADVEILLEGNAIGGLVLFYNNNFNSGVLAQRGNILANLRGWQFVTEKQVIENHVFLRLRNRNNTVDMFYSTDGVKWTKIENSLDVSGLHHNVLSGFMSLRIGLCAIGEGTVTFKNFNYQSID
jgi:beta-xylosidase